MAIQRGMVYINVIKVSLIPRRELNYVVKTDKGERPSGENCEKKYKYSNTPSWCDVRRVNQKVVQGGASNQTYF